MTSPTPPPTDTDDTVTYRPSHARDIRSKGFYVKLALMMLVNALGLYGMFSAYAVQSWTILAVLVVILIVVNYVYFSSKMVPAKYLVPGLIFLLIYKVFVMGYTAYVSFTNYGQGHNSTKADAISAVLMQNQRRVEGAPTVPMAVVEDGPGLGLAVANPDTNTVSVGSPNSPLEAVDGAVIGSMGIQDIPGYTLLNLGQLASRQNEVAGLAVPVSDNPSDGYYVTTDGTSGYLARSILTYDAAADTMTNQDTGVVYTADGSRGFFTSADGQNLQPGWRVFVGFSNYTSMVAGSDLAAPFFKALIWSFAFAFLSVFTTFAFGLFLALVMADERVKGRKVIQSLLILPYAFPAFLATLVWQGMLNTDFGFINQVLLGGADIPWLTNGWLARLSIIGVNLWLGFPYMFLVSLGALQSLPSDIMEAAKIDGATGLRTVLSVKLPLVLQSTIPLLIASFAFNFNNFSLIYMLTGGGPNYPGLSVPIGETDILISMVYTLAFDGGGTNYGLASAMSIVIFIVVGLISWIGFRQTRTLEEI